MTTPPAPTGRPRTALELLADCIERLQQAPSLPYATRCVEIVDGLTQSGDPDDAGPAPAAAVRRGILALALELNALLPKAAEHAQQP